MEICACCKRALILSTPASRGCCKADHWATTAACAFSSRTGAPASPPLRPNKSEAPMALAMLFAAWAAFAGRAMVISTSASATLAVSCSDRKACRRLRRMSRQTRAKPAPIRMPLRTRMIPVVMTYPHAPLRRRPARLWRRHDGALQIGKALLALPRFLHLYAPRFDEAVHILD